MPLLVRLAREPALKKSRRNGIATHRRDGWISGHDRFVWAHPVLESSTLTRQWSGELKRHGTRRYDGGRGGAPLPRPE